MGEVKHYGGIGRQGQMNTESTPEALEVPAERKTLTVAEAGEALGIGRNQAYQAVRDGKIPSIRIGKRWLVPKAALDRLLAGERD